MVVKQPAIVRRMEVEVDRETESTFSPLTWVAVTQVNLLCTNFLRYNLQSVPLFLIHYILLECFRNKVVETKKGKNQFLPSNFVCVCDNNFLLSLDK